MWSTHNGLLVRHRKKKSSSANVTKMNWHTTLRKKEAGHKWTNKIGFHAYEIPRIGKFKIVIIRG